MTRRAFFVTLAAAAIAFDPEKALWIPGRRLISIPRPMPEFNKGNLVNMVSIFEVYDQAGFLTDEIETWIPRPGQIIRYRGSIANLQKLCTEAGKTLERA